jgi:hypothetical protein
MAWFRPTRMQARHSALKPASFSGSSGDSGISAEHGAHQSDGSQGAQSSLIYVALNVLTAAAVVIATGVEHLSRTAHRQIEQP